MTCVKLWHAAAAAVVAVLHARFAPACFGRCFRLRCLRPGLYPRWGRAAAVPFFIDMDLAPYPYQLK